MKKRSLYLDCHTGISGDMVVAALLDAGADREVLETVLRSIPVSGFEIAISRVQKAALSACDFKVILDAAHENHDHDMKYLYGKEESHAHGEHHHHEHRGLTEIYSIIDGTNMLDSARTLAKKIFRILAEAEAKAHGVPVELGRAYSEQGADELVFLDITASHEGRKTFTELVKRIAANINIPFTVGGGINELSDVDRLLNAGADKISINSSAIRNPRLVDEIAKNFGSQVCVLAVDAKQTENGWKCYLNGGRIETDKDLFEWTKEAQERGAGEILFTSMNHDGVKAGYANEALAALADQLSIPIIASGGAGCKEHFRDVFLQGKADAALAASVFHFGEIKIPELKSYLCGEGITIRG